MCSINIFIFACISPTNTARNTLKSYLSFLYTRFSAQLGPLTRERAVTVPAVLYTLRLPDIRGTPQRHSYANFGVNVAGYDSIYIYIYIIYISVRIIQSFGETYFVRLLHLKCHVKAAVFELTVAAWRLPI